MKVLIADDDPTTRELLAELLGSEGHEVHVAGSGASALAALETFPAELALIDLYMPNLDGRQFLAVLRADPRWRSLPVVVLTAASDDLLSGVRVLRKPVEAATLLAVLAETLP